MRSGLLGWLARTKSLAGFFLATLLLLIGFQMLIGVLDGPLLDTLTTGDAAVARFNQMDEYQRAAHLRGTIILDGLFPLAYGGLLVGLISRFAWRWRWVFIWIPIVCGLLDYSENLVQAMALGGHGSEILHAKTIITPLKFGALLLSLGLCAGLCLLALARHLTKRADTKDISS